MSTNHHGTLYALAQAASDGDAVADERGLEAALTDLGLSLEDTLYVAEQRALRAVLIAGGRTEELRSFSRTEPSAVQLSEEEQSQIKLLQSVYLDGIALGVRYQQRRASSFGIGKEVLGR